MKVVWTLTARITYFKILEYLDKEWTFREIQKFVNEVEDVIDRIKEDPHMFESSRYKAEVRKGRITKHRKLYYRVKSQKKVIELLTFWDNRQNPNRLSY